MVEGMMPYNLTEEHVQGQDNKVADFGWRYQRDQEEAETSWILGPSKHAKSKGVGIFCLDSVDQKIERVVLIEIEYQILIPIKRTESKLRAM